MPYTQLFPYLVLVGAFVPKEKLQGYGFLEGVHDDCAIYDPDPDSCVVLKECVQNLMN